jgi:hypothetical protein
LNSGGIWNRCKTRVIIPSQEVPILPGLRDLTTVNRLPDLTVTAKEVHTTGIMLTVTDRRVPDTSVKAHLMEAVQRILPTDGIMAMATGREATTVIIAGTETGKGVKTVITVMETAIMVTETGKGAKTAIMVTETAMQDTREVLLLTRTVMATGMETTEAEENAGNTETVIRIMLISQGSPDNTVTSRAAPHRIPVPGIRIIPDILQLTKLWAWLYSMPFLFWHRGQGYFITEAKTDKSVIG